MSIKQFQGLIAAIIMAALMSLQVSAAGGGGGGSGNLDLADYPYPFAKDGQPNTIVVVGDQAPSSDVISSVDIIAGVKEFSEVVDTGKPYAETRFKISAKLASEVADPFAQNVISVGGACINAVTFTLQGEPANCATGAVAGQGFIRLIQHSNGNAAIIVSGYYDADIRRAAHVLANYKKWQDEGKFYGGEVIVTGTSFSDLTIIPIKRRTGEGNTKGSKSAPVLMIEYGDFQCPFCKRFFEQTLPQIERNYIDSGKVKLTYKHFPLVSIHPNAQKAAEAAECASDQGKFWEMHDIMFENQNYLEVDSLKEYAGKIGLDTAAFSSCLDSGIKAAKVNSDLKEGEQAGISGTPGFLISGRVVTGAQPFSVFEEAIEEALGSKNQTATCTDSDGGQDSAVRGRLVDTERGYDVTDYCIDSDRLVEYLCNPGFSYVYEDCAGQGKVCSNGACSEKAPAGVCTDSDGGTSPYVYGIVNDRDGMAASDSCEVVFWNYQRQFWDSKYVESCDAGTNNDLFSPDDNPTGSKRESCNVKEWTCNERGENNGRPYYCKYGCNRGKCLQSPEESPAIDEPPEFPTEEVAEIELERGWNLISMPGELQRFLPSECTANRKLIGFIYLADLGEYVTMQEAQRILGPDFGRYVARHAFWVYSYKECTLSARVNEMEIDVQASSGWNLLPITEELAGRTFGEVTSTCDIEQAFRWDAGLQEWGSIASQEPFYNWQVNKGIVIKSGNSCTLG